MRDVNRNMESGGTRRALGVIARTAGGAVGLLAGGMAVGWLPVLFLFGGRLVVAADSASFIPFFALGFLVGAMFGVAAGTALANRVLRHKISLTEAFVGGLAGLAGGVLLEFLYWVTLNAVNPPLDGRLAWTMSAAAIYAPVWIGAVIGSGWMVKPDESP